MKLREVMSAARIAWSIYQALRGRRKQEEVWDSREVPGELGRTGNLTVESRPTLGKAIETYQRVDGIVKAAESLDDLVDGLRKR